MHCLFHEQVAQWKHKNLRTTKILAHDCCSAYITMDHRTDPWVWISLSTFLHAPSLNEREIVEFVTIWLQEFGKHDKEPAKFIKQWTGNNSRTGAPFACDVGYERFLAPEVWPNLMLAYTVSYQLLSACEEKMYVYDIVHVRCCLYWRGKVGKDPILLNWGDIMDSAGVWIIWFKILPL